MNLNEKNKLIQISLKNRGLYTGNIDGLYGPLMADGVLTALEIPGDEVVLRPGYEEYDFAWSSKFTPEFRESIRWTANAIELPDADNEGASALASCMAFETGETFRPDIKNPGSSATGLIQFMEATAKGMGTTTAALAKMTQVEQMNYVYRYFKPYTGKLKNLADIYMAILWPAGIGKPLDHVLWSRGSSAYAANKGLDLDNSGTITKAEAYACVKAKYDKGMLLQNRLKK